MLRFMFFGGFSVNEGSAIIIYICLLSAVSKLLEKLIFEKLAPIVYATLTPDQHNCRPK